jgi:hypothetical protein
MAQGKWPEIKKSPLQAAGLSPYLFEDMEETGEL